MKISSLIPDAGAMLKLSPVELGCALLKVIDSLPETQRHRGNYLMSPDATSDYPTQSHQEVKEAQSENWEWLRSNGYIAPQVEGSNPDFIYITRKGRDYLVDCSSRNSGSRPPSFGHTYVRVVQFTDCLGMFALSRASTCGLEGTRLAARIAGFRGCRTTTTAGRDS